VAAFPQRKATDFFLLLRSSQLMFGCDLLKRGQLLVVPFVQDNAVLHQYYPRVGPDDGLQHDVIAPVEGVVRADGFLEVFNVGVIGKLGHGHYGVASSPGRSDHGLDVFLPFFDVTVVPVPGLSLEFVGNDDKGVPGVLQQCWYLIVAFGVADFKVADFGGFDGRLGRLGIVFPLAFGVLLIYLEELRGGEFYRFSVGLVDQGVPNRLNRGGSILFGLLGGRYVGAHLEGAEILAGNIPGIVAEAVEQYHYGKAQHGVVTGFFGK
jgi:hypothetical protein